MKFISVASIVLKSGKGGDGIISWRRESKIRRGGPAGGSGGRGGSVYIESDENLNSLFHVRHIRYLKAKDGENGRNKSQQGSDAEDVCLKVPCGTNVFDKATGELLHEFIEPNERFLICKGGEGGRGNCSFKSSKKPAPYLYELGDPAEEKEVILDLQTISDIGFLGKPNAGKSSLLSAISNARPKVASFPFTTLIPVLGTVNFRGQKLVFADIPGLIENASKGSGLGIEFLKHLNRCHLILHLVDASEEDPIREIKMIENELKSYSEEIYGKPRLLVLNKIDLIPGERLKTISSSVKNTWGVDPICISILNNVGIDELLEKSFGEFYKHSLDRPKFEKPEYLEINDPDELFQQLEIIRGGDNS